MAITPTSPTFSSPVRGEIVILSHRIIVCWEIHEGTRYVAHLLEDYSDLFDLPKDRPVDRGWRGRHIGWDACADAVIVRDDRFPSRPSARV